MMVLRDYQQAAKDAFYAHLRGRDDNGCIVIPTGGGKTPIIASICHDVVHRWGGRVLVLTHVKELVEQTVEKLQIISPGTGIGVYSAGLRRKELGYSVTVASIQSIYQRAPNVGRVEIILVDEAHLIPPDGDGMYQQFFREIRIVNPKVRIGGLTATPYRLKGGMICGPDNVLNHICYEAGVRELIARGYLAPLRTKGGVASVDPVQFHVRQGEYVAAEMEQAFNRVDIVTCSVKEILQETQDRRSVLIFTSGQEHGKNVVDTFATLGHECGWIDGNTPAAERNATIERFRAGKLKYLANINVLTTGFDAPAIDCVAIMRSTMSPGLYYQMVGRGFRMADGKDDCLILDYGKNVLSHGPVDALSDRIKLQHAYKRPPGEAPIKQCLQCREIIPAWMRTCEACGFEFPPPPPPAFGARHDPEASAEGILSDQITRTRYEVTDVAYGIHYKGRNYTNTPTLRVDYFNGVRRIASEWICIEHVGFAQEKAAKWWQIMSRVPMPGTVEEAVEIANAGYLARVNGITIEHRPGEKYDRVVGYDIDDPPPPPSAEEADGLREFLGARGGFFTVDDVIEAALPWCEMRGMAPDDVRADATAAIEAAIARGEVQPHGEGNYVSLVAPVDSMCDEIPF